VVSMGYIRFVFIYTIILMGLLSSPVCSSPEEKTIIYYSKNTLTVGDVAYIEQGYSFQLIDFNKKSGDILLKVYYKGEEIDVEDFLGNKNKPVEYIKTIEQKDDEETDYVIFRIRPIDFNEKDKVTYVEVEIEQFLDPLQDDKDFLMLDTSKAVKRGETLFLEENYTLEAIGFEDDSVILELSKDGKPLKEEELEIGDIFSYYKEMGNNSRTIFIARVSKFFESSDSSTVILKDVTQRSDLEENKEGNLIQNLTDENQQLMAIPDNINNITGDTSNQIATDNSQNSTLLNIGGENKSNYKNVDTDSFMPILFLVIITMGIAILKFS